MATWAAILSKLGAVVLLVGCLAGLVLLGFVPLLGRIEQLNESVTAQRQLLGRLQASLANAEHRDQGSAASDGGRSLFLEGESNAVMAAQLQAILRAPSEPQGWRLISVQPLPLRQQGSVQLVGVEVRLSATSRSLQDLLLHLESARPVIIVSALHITAMATSQADAIYEPEQLTVRLEIFGGSMAGNTEATNATPLQR